MQQKRNSKIENGIKEWDELIQKVK